ncbi:glycosyltransferase family 4 protein [Candidatus Gracilibacteria bacterium]|nr:glycosyltransferase family 4 protein [Candidatus Gracilibacteria bacterium]
MKKKIAFVAPVRGGGPYELYKNLVKELNDNYEDIDCNFVSGVKPWLQLHINRDKYEIIISSIPFLWKPIGSKFILNINGIFWKELSFSLGGIIALLYPYNSLFADKIIYSSDFLRKKIGYGKIKSDVIYPFVIKENHNHKKNNFLKEKKEINMLTVTSFSFLDKAKGVIDIIKKLQIIDCDKNITFTVVGGGKYLKYIKKQVSSLELDKNINILFTGMLNKSEVYNLYISSDIFIYSTFQDTFGISIIEAMSFCLPVILNNYILFNEIFPNILRVDDSEDFINVLNNLINNSDFYEHSIKQSLITCNTYSSTNIVPQWYKKVIINNF